MKRSAFPFVRRGLEVGREAVLGHEVGVGGELACEVVATAKESLEIHWPGSELRNLPETLVEEELDVEWLGDVVASLSIVFGLLGIVSGAQTLRRAAEKQGALDNVHQLRMALTAGLLQMPDAKERLVELTIQMIGIAGGAAVQDNMTQHLLQSPHLAERLLRWVAAQEGFVQRTVSRARGSGKADVAQGVILTGGGVSHICAVTIVKLGLLAFTLSLAAPLLTASAAGLATGKNGFKAHPHRHRSRRCLHCIKALSATMIDIGKMQGLSRPLRLALLWLIEERISQLQLTRSDESRSATTNSLYASGTAAATTAGISGVVGLLTVKTVAVVATIGACGTGVLGAVLLLSGLVSSIAHGVVQKRRSRQKISEEINPALHLLRRAVAQETASGQTNGQVTQLVERILEAGLPAVEPGFHAIQFVAAPRTAIQRSGAIPPRTQRKKSDAGHRHRGTTTSV